MQDLCLHEKVSGKTFPLAIYQKTNYQMRGCFLYAILKVFTKHLLSYKSHTCMHCLNQRFGNQFEYITLLFRLPNTSATGLYTCTLHIYLIPSPCNLFKGWLAQFSAKSTYIRSLDNLSFFVGLQYIIVNCEGSFLPGTFSISVSITAFSVSYKLYTLTRQQACNKS